MCKTLTQLPQSSSRIQREQYVITTNSPWDCTESGLVVSPQCKYMKSGLLWLHGRAQIEALCDCVLERSRTPERHTEVHPLL